MNCDLIFYLASKTSQCEKSLKKSLESLRFSIRNVHFATDSVTLGENLIKALQTTDLVFIIGGLFTTESTSIVNVLSKALSKHQPDNVYKLKNQISLHDGYIIEKGKQLIVLLPDSPDQINSMLNDTFKFYVEQKCN